MDEKTVDQVRDAGAEVLEQGKRALDRVLQEDLGSWFDLSGWRLQALVALFGLVVLLWLSRKIRRALRRRRPPTIHPKLQKYGQDYYEPSEKHKAQRRKQAEKVQATSSTGEIAGYEIVEQVEAVFVDGFRRPEDALEGLKAVAALKGANALTNLRHERTSSGRFSASGDAMVIRKLGAEANKGPEVLESAGPKPDAGRSDDP